MARIAIVEDDVYMREELENLLKKNGYEVFSILDFENVISCIISYSPDLILLDINLPFYSGFELCKELKSKQLGTVLILTARDRLQDELHAFFQTVCVVPHEPDDSPLADGRHIVL